MLWHLRGFKHVRGPHHHPRNAHPPRDLSDDDKHSRAKPLHQHFPLGLVLLLLQAILLLPQAALLLVLPARGKRGSGECRNSIPDLNCSSNPSILSEMRLRCMIIVCASAHHAWQECTKKSQSLHDTACQSYLWWSFSRGSASEARRRTVKFEESPSVPAALAGAAAIPAGVLASPNALPPAAPASASTSTAAHTEDLRLRLD